MTNSEKSLLLYLETCCVDYGGLVDSTKMNGEDLATVKKWNQCDYIQFGRVYSKDIDIVKRSHWVILSDQAWADAASERRARFTRINAKRQWQTTDERFARPAETPQEQEAHNA